MFGCKVRIKLIVMPIKKINFKYMQKVYAFGKREITFL